MICNVVVWVVVEVALDHCLQLVKLHRFEQNLLHTHFEALGLGGLIILRCDCHDGALAPALKLEDVFLLPHVGEPNSLRSDDLLAETQSIHRLHPNVGEDKSERAGAASLLQLLLEAVHCHSTLIEDRGIQVELLQQDLHRN